jgi:hypothetical protein
MELIEWNGLILYVFEYSTCYQLPLSVFCRLYWEPSQAAFINLNTNEDIQCTKQKNAL